VPKRFSWIAWAWSFPTVYDSPKGSPICSANFAGRVGENEEVSMFLDWLLRKLG